MLRWCRCRWKSAPEMTVDKVLRDACLTGGGMKNRLAIVGILVGVVPNAIGGAMAGPRPIPFMSDRSLGRSRLARLTAVIAAVAGAPGLGPSC